MRFVVFIISFFSESGKKLFCGSFNGFGQSAKRTPRLSYRSGGRFNVPPHVTEAWQRALPGGNVRDQMQTSPSGDNFNLSLKSIRSSAAVTRRPGIAYCQMQTLPSGDSFKLPLKHIRSSAAGTARPPLRNFAHPISILLPARCRQKI